MATSQQMSKIHTGMNLASGSKEADQNLSSIQERVGRVLRKKYKVGISCESMIYNPELYDHIPDRPKHMLEAKNPHKTGIRPDGGVLVVYVEKGEELVRLPILISENKQQGTGKDQARGNAVERLAKNLMFCQTWLADEDIMPFVAFCYGMDFEGGSYIIDRVATMAHYHPANKVHVFKDKRNLGGMSWFYRNKKFTSKEMYDILYEVAEKSLKYYIKKYDVS